MSFRKPCHMPFRKLIPPFTLTVSQASYVTLREDILKPRLEDKKMLVRSGGVRIFSKSSFIMCNGSLGRHGNSLGIQRFLQSSQARSRSKLNQTGSTWTEFLSEENVFF